jgi:hypothetical protein
VTAITIHGVVVVGAATIALSRIAHDSIFATTGTCWTAASRSTPTMFAAGVCRDSAGLTGGVGHQQDCPRLTNA